jgi:hypothetical protein
MLEYSARSQTLEEGGGEGKGGKDGGPDGGIISSCRKAVSIFCREGDGDDAVGVTFSDGDGVHAGQVHAVDGPIRCRGNGLWSRRQTVRGSCRGV